MSLDARDDAPTWVAALIARHRRVEALVHRQARDGDRHALVEELVHKQHLAQLRAKLLPLPAADLVSLLDRLDIEDGQMIWDLIADLRGRELLDHLPVPVRDALAATNGGNRGTFGVTVFQRDAAGLRHRMVHEAGQFDASDTVWIDLADPGWRQCDLVEQGLGLRLPDVAKLAMRESNPGFGIDEDGTLRLTAGFLSRDPARLERIPVAFALRGDTLISLHAVDLPVFRMQRLRTRFTSGPPKSGRDLLLELFATSVEQTAAELERIYGQLNEPGRGVPARQLSDADAARVLSQIAHQESDNGKLRRNLHETRRLLSHMLRSRAFDDAQQESARQILRDIESLDGHTDFLFGKMQFRLDTTVGLINVRQNHKVSGLTVVGVVLAPMNVLVGIGGMSEFSLMTSGLSWPIAYGGLVAGFATLGLVIWVGLHRPSAAR